VLATILSVILTLGLQPGSGLAVVKVRILRFYAYTFHGQMSSFLARF